MNNVNLIGRTTKETVLRKTQNGKRFTYLTLAVNSTKDETNFIDCIAWEDTAQRIAEFVKKGDRIAISGKLEVFNEQKEDKTYENKSQVLIQNLTFLENKPKEEK